MSLMVSPAVADLEPPLLKCKTLIIIDAGSSFQVDISSHICSQLESLCDSGCASSTNPCNANNTIFQEHLFRLSPRARKDIPWWPWKIRLSMAAETALSCTIFAMGNIPRLCKSAAIRREATSHLSLLHLKIRIEAPMPGSRKSWKI